MVHLVLFEVLPVTISKQTKTQSADGKINQNHALVCFNVCRTVGEHLEENTPPLHKIINYYLKAHNYKVIHLLVAGYLNDSNLLL